MSLVHPRPDDEPVRAKRALVERVEKLVEQGVLTGDLLEQARAGDYVVMIDFEAERYTVAVRDDRAVGRRARVGRRRAAHDGLWGHARASRH